jgi:flagellin-like hook-associated protein FlgL
MAAILSTNMASLYAQKNLSTAQASLSTSVQRLSSGTRINSAKDDAAGYGIAESIKGTKAITDQSILNTKNAISQVQTAEGALDVVGKILQRVLTLTTQRQDGTLNSDQTTSINNEIASLLNEVQNIKERTQFNGSTGSVFGATNTLSTGAGVASTIEIANLSLGGGAGGAAPYWVGTFQDLANAGPEGPGDQDTLILLFPSDTFPTALPPGTRLYIGDGTVKIDIGFSVTSFTTNPDGTQSVEYVISEEGGMQPPSWVDWANANNLMNSPENVIASFEAPGRSTPPTMSLGAPGADWIDSITPNFQGDINSNGPAFYMPSYIANASEVRAGMQVLKNGEDTGLVVSSVQYIPGLDQLDYGGYEIKTTGAGDDLTQTFEGVDVITFANGAASQTNYIDSFNPELTYVTSVAPISGLAAGNALADGNGRYLGTVTDISGNRITLSNFDPPSSSAVHLITSTAVLDTQAGNGDSILAISAANSSIVTGSVITDRYGSYIGTVDGVSGDGLTITLTAPINLSHMEVETSPGAVIQISAPSESPVTSENDPHSLNLVDASGADAAANGKIAYSAYLDGSGNVLSLEANDVADLSSSAVQGAIQINSTNRADLGAWLNRLEYAVDNMQTLSTNLADGISRIVDTDYAAETSNLTRTQIMQQAATSMLAQANQMPNVILTLLK